MFGFSIEGGTAPFLLTSLGDGSELEIQENEIIERDNSTAFEAEWLITDANGCSINYLFTLTEPAQLEFVINEQQPASCFDVSDAYISFQIEGGTAPYQIITDEGDIMIIENNEAMESNEAEAGIYNLTIIDANECSIMTTVTITQPDELIIDQISLEHDDGSGNGSITVSAFGGTGTYTYSLNNEDFQTNPTFNDLVEGEYSVTVMDENGCMSTETVNPAVAIYGGDCSDPLLIYNVVDNNCNGSEGPELIFSDLEEGEEYLIRIWSEDGTSNGTFGLFLGTNIPALLSFEVFGDASVMGDCIELTPEEDGQQGCAWYQLEVDFSQPFTHEMIANFGDSNFFGADGICLVYQSNGPDFCGTSGAGIGAEGMPNSAIFEFDTYRNGGPYGDPFGDHTSFNINGNMTHAASIDGPVTTGNLEDGDDHNITFTWNPDGNLYELFLDGELQLSGSFDIINNCFGGESIAYWGYTSSTGSSNNNHIICPLNVEYTPAPVTYEEISICADGEYNGWTEPGFYITEETDVDGCIRCDSTINLFLKVIIPTLTINGSQTLDCSTDTILLTIDFDVTHYTVQYSIRRSNTGCTRR